jgi:hypothetical protein
MDAWVVIIISQNIVISYKISFLDKHLIVENIKKHCSSCSCSRPSISGAIG